MIKKLFLGALSATVLSSFSQVVPNIDWVQYKSERSQISNVPSAIDANNNAFITGYMFASSTNANANTVKYDATGLELWTASYDFNGGFDNSKAIVVDAAGNSYVTGESDGTGTMRDVITIKYDPNGTQLWASRFNGTSNGNDVGNSIVVDPSGNVFVTGYSTNSSGNRDYITIKYDANGVQLFAVSFAGAGNQNDEAVALAFNNSRLYITGTSVNASGNSDLVTQRLNPTTGATLWTKSANGTANSNDIAYALLAYNNDVVAVGQVNNNTTGNDYLTVRYNGNNGNVQFSKVYDFANTSGGATALTADINGSFAVTGLVNNAGIYEYHTVLYNNNGVQQWVNKVSSGLPYSSVNPQIAVDPIFNHFYVCGQKSNNNSDVFVYQITPSGNKSWEQKFNGSLNGQDAAVDLVVNANGVIYVAAACLNSNAKFDYTTIRISQTPTYTVPNSPNSNDVQSQNWIYYENKGQILKSGTSTVEDEVFYYTQFTPYVEYIGLNKMSYKICKLDTAIGVNDTTQRVDIVFHKSNTRSTIYASKEAEGIFNFMHGEALTNEVTDVRGFRNLGIPNLYPGIDQHYTSNADGMKIQYVLKPMANPYEIQWKIQGADSAKIVNNKLEIYHHKGKIVWAQPVAYTTNAAGNAQSIAGSSTWTLLPNDNFGIVPPPSYNPSFPLFIEIDKGNTVFPPYPPIKNLVASLYYGGWTDEGFIDVDVDPVTKNWVAIGSTRGGDYANAFPISPGAQISITSYTNTPNEYMFVLVFKSDGTLVTSNTYGLSGAMKPLRAILNGTLVTVVGNCNIGGQLPLYTSQQAALTPGTYTYATGQGYVMQFEITTAQSSTIQSINTIRWTTRLNGNASDIDVTPNGKNIYVTSTTNYSLLPMQSLAQTGSYNNGGLTSLTDNNFQVWKFDSLGVRKWSSVLPIINSASSPSTGNVPYYNEYSNTALVMNAEYYLKCKIKADNYGFYITGETNSPGNLSYSKYGAPFDATHNGFNDGFFMRFNKKDSLVYSSYVGGNIDDAFNELVVVNPNEVALVGYSNSKQNGLLTAPTATAYSDTTMDNGNNTKLLICKFDSIGNKKWATFYGKNSFTDNAIGWSITKDNKGYIYMTGMNNNKLPSFTNPATLFSQSNIANSESFMLAFDSGNQPVWNTKFGGVEDDIGLALDFNNHQGTNYIIMGGMTPSRSQPYLLPSMSYSFPVVEKPFGSVTTWTQTYVIIGRSDGFFSFFTTDVVTGIEEYFNDEKLVSTFELFPNPTQYETNIAFKNSLEGKVDIEMYNQLGQVVAILEEKDLPAHSLIKINTANIPPGLYIVSVKNRGKVYSKKLVISR